MDYDATIAAKATKVEQLKLLAERVKGKLADTIKYVSVDDNTISFFKTADGSGTAAFTVDFPEELFLDQLKTKFESNFNFASGSYTGATDPHLDGKPVMVLAVKGDKGALTYSFVDVSSLVDTYTAKAGDSAKVLNISGYEIEFKVSAAEGNILEIKNDGIYASTSALATATGGKADKVDSATADNLAALDADGNLADSGIAKADVMSKVASAVENNIATFDANGKVKDSGVAFATDAEVTAMLDEVFGASDSGNGD